MITRATKIMVFLLFAGAFVSATGACFGKPKKDKIKNKNSQSKNSVPWYQKIPSYFGFGNKPKNPKKAAVETVPDKHEQFGTDNKNQVLPRINKSFKPKNKKYNSTALDAHRSPAHEVDLINKSCKLGRDEHQWIEKNEDKKRQDEKVHKKIVEQNEQASNFADQMTEAIEMRKKKYLVQKNLNRLSPAHKFDEAKRDRSKIKRVANELTIEHLSPAHEDEEIQEDNLKFKKVANDSKNDMKSIAIDNKFRHELNLAKLQWIENLKDKQVLFERNISNFNLNQFSQASDGAMLRDNQGEIDEWREELKHLENQTNIVKSTKACEMNVSLSSRCFCDISEPNHENAYCGTTYHGDVCIDNKFGRKCEYLRMPELEVPVEKAI